MGGLRVSSTKDDTNYNLKSIALKGNLEDIIQNDFDEEVTENEIQRHEDKEIL